MSIEEAQEQVIIMQVEQLHAMLGTPNDIPETVHQLAIKIHVRSFTLLPEFVDRRHHCLRCGV